MILSFKIDDDNSLQSNPPAEKFKKIIFYNQ